MDNKNLLEKAKQIRKVSLQMLYEADGGHLASSMSTVELLCALYFAGILKYDAKNPKWLGRDYFLLSNGHACTTFYVVLAEAGFFKPEKLKDIFRLDSGLEGHPMRGALPGIEISSGSLGMGLSVGLGVALGLALEKRNNKVVVMMSDGEQDEGSVWEAAMAAGHYQPKNLTAIIDRNGIQIAGRTEENMKLEPLERKYQSFGWQVININGHDFVEITSAFKQAEANQVPTVIIASTIPAKGVWRLEGKADTHHPKIDKEIFDITIKNLS